MRHKVIPGARLDLWRSKSLRLEVEDELSRMNGWKNGAVQPHYFCVKQRCIYTPVSQYLMWKVQGGTLSSISALDSHQKGHRCVQQVVQMC